MPESDSKSHGQSHHKPPVEADVPCPVCREPIKPGARKCIHCDSVLDWRGWLGVSQTTLALLVALISVVAGTAPQIKDLLTPKTSSLVVSFRQVLNQNLELIGWNQGHMSAQVQSARISAVTVDGKQIEALPLSIQGFPTVFSQQQALFGLLIPPADIPKFLDWPHLQIKSATLSVVVSEYKKPPDTRIIDLPLGYFRLFCRATEDADRFSRFAMESAAITAGHGTGAAPLPAEQNAALAALVAKDNRTVSKCIAQAK